MSSSEFPNSLSHLFSEFLSCRHRERGRPAGERKQMSVLAYFTLSLDLVGIEGEVFAPFLLGVCAEAGDEAGELLLDLLAGAGAASEQAQALAGHLLQVYRRGYLIDSELSLFPAGNSAIQPQCASAQANNDDKDKHKSDSNSFAPPAAFPTASEGCDLSETQAIEEECQSLEEYDAVQSEFFDPFEAEGEGEREGVDWLSLLEQVEQTLHSAHSLSFSFSAEALYKALLYTHCNVQRACALLAASYASLLSCRPCRHLVGSQAGGCYRRDCIFQHNLGELVCRYWLVTSCVSPACPFLHDLPGGRGGEEGERQRDRQGEREGERVGPSSASAEAFPSLPVSHNKKKRNKNAFVNYKQAVEKRPPLSSSAPSSSSFTVPLSSSTFSSSQSWREPKTLDALGFIEGLQHLHYLPPKREEERGLGQWIAGGDSVRGEYQKLREEARQLSISRSKLYEEATVAFIGGKRDLARSLSQKARALSNHFHESQLEAAKEMFRTRNSQESLTKGVVDLHGLHVREALACLEELAGLFEQTRLSSFKVVTGTGHHSAQGRARLLPSVLQWLEERGYRYETIKDRHSGLTGGVLVRLSSY